MTAPAARPTERTPALTGGGGDWPRLPIGIKHGVAGQAGQRIYVGLGSAGSALYTLNLAAVADGWRELAPFPGPVTDDAAAAMAGGRLYVFSGAGKARPGDAAPIVFTDVHAYDPASNAWRRLDTLTPVGLLGASARALDDDRIAIFGGYDKTLFDNYVRDLQAIDKDREPARWQALVDGYMGMEPKEYRWNARVLVYTISTNAWSDLGETPYPPTTGAALVEGDDGILLINGEIKPGLRTAQVSQASITDGEARWSVGAPLPALPGEDSQEGLAGAYAGFSNGALIVAGGVNFPGARGNAEAGRWYAHKGLAKTWRADVYARVDGAWKVAGQLPRGLAYGASFRADDGLLVVGGEDGALTARTEVFLVRWDGSSTVVTD